MLIFIQNYSKMARREINVFNIAFLDLLSGALAAVLILFIVVPKLTAEAVETLEEFEKLELEVSEVKDKLEDLKKSIPKEIFEELEEKFEELEKEIDDLEKTVASLRKKMSELEAKLKKCEEDRAALEKRVEELEEEVEELKKENTTITEELKASELENEELKSEVKELKAEVTNAERALSLTKKLDIVFVMDCTSSMKDEIANLKANLVGIVRVLQKTVESVHIGFVAYRDHGDAYVTKEFPITDMGTGLGRLINFVNGLSAEGGGDDKEAVDEAMAEANALIWRGEGVKQVMVVIGDVSAHDEDIETCYRIARQFRARPTKSKVSTIYANEADTYANFFKSVASNGGGDFVKDKGRMMESILLSVMD